MKVRKRNHSLYLGEGAPRDEKPCTAAGAPLTATRERPEQQEDPATNKIFKKGKFFHELESVFLWAFRTLLAPLCMAALQIFEDSPFQFVNRGEM